METAYLLGFVDTSQWPPVMVGAGIFSESHGSITTEQRKRFAVELQHCNASTYGEAADLLLRMVKDHPWYQWIWNLMCEGRPGEKDFAFCERQALIWMEQAQAMKLHEEAP